MHEKRKLAWCDSWSGKTPAWAEQADILKLISASQYAAGQLRRDPDIFTLFEAEIDWSIFDFATSLAALRDAEDEKTLMRGLRREKHRYQTAFIYAVLIEKLTQAKFIVALSRLAAALVDIALAWQYQNLCIQGGQPLDAQGNPLQMVVFAMGKFGGEELNFSSDIDLIFAYRNGGETSSILGSKTLDHEIFFRKLAQKLIATLDHVTEDGFVYRVDMRLRPFGQTGPLALTFDALDTYYQLHGRDWERYAMMKARPVAGDVSGGENLLRELKPFMYRRYLDYTSLTSIAEMKSQINRQIREAGMENHLKLGRGGIREAEFSVQAMQLIYGGQYPRLQSPHFLDVLHNLAELKLWDQSEVIALRDAYLFLRTVENALQFDQEQQIHHLPNTLEAWQRLVLACNFNSIEALQNALNCARETIHRKFCLVFEEDAPSEQEEDNIFSCLNWQLLTAEDISSVCLGNGISQTSAEALGRQLTEFSSLLPWQRLPARTVERLEKLLPMLLDIACQEKSPEHAVAGILDLIREVSGRSVYIDMLSEQPRLISHLLAIGRDSVWLINFIRDHPLVLDEVLTERENVADVAQLSADLSARLEGLDEEEWLHALRDFKHAQLFKVAWADVHGNLSLMRVSDNLSLIAELVLQHTYCKAYDVLSARYGVPRDADGRRAAFAIIGYGKLGGWELSYGSDLDVIFLYDDQRAQGMTDGEKSIPNQMFFTRLVQRMTNYLTAPSTSGKLYEIDTQLRPGGKSGMLVSSLDAFREYQCNHAWIWEHQALTRARHIIGDANLCTAFEKIRREVLMRKPDDNLAGAVLEMRKKMLENVVLPDATQFHLKQSEGGLIDIEFIVQYLLLKHSIKEPILIRMSDNIRQLAALEVTGILPSIDAMILRDTYRHLRNSIHYCFLNNKDNVVKAAPWEKSRGEIRRIWRTVFSLSA